MGQGDGLTFSGTKVWIEGGIHPAGRADFQPAGWAGDPGSDEGRSGGTQHFVLDSGRDDDFFVKGFKNIDLFDEDEVVQWACVCDDDHAAALAGKRSWRVFMSCSKSAAV